MNVWTFVEYQRNTDRQATFRAFVSNLRQQTTKRTNERITFDLNRNDHTNQSTSCLYVDDRDLILSYILSMLRDNVRTIQYHRNIYSILRSIACRSRSLRSLSVVSWIVFDDCSSCTLDLRQTNDNRHGHVHDRKTLTGHVCRVWRYELCLTNARAIVIVRCSTIERTTCVHWCTNNEWIRTEK
jgi:hypothetical protein